ncbi:hypothetical protein COV17_00295 [Candidatus Woesearchaeota archaeon CG10_big_fil_rev_8_21_14_0_10_36_11]|nr:MAG: hypothetical protein COV17_00295 [Candidatus Woesearchaeota archaeon CG10_big_fil_rev_8_21_14_0_10_36_11]
MSFQTIPTPNDLKRTEDHQRNTSHTKTLEHLTAKVTRELPRAMAIATRNGELNTTGGTIHYNLSLDVDGYQEIDPSEVELIMEHLRESKWYANHDGNYVDRSGFVSEVFTLRPLPYQTNRV